MRNRERHPLALLLGKMSRLALPVLASQVLFQLSALSDNIIISVLNINISIIISVVLRGGVELHHLAGAIASIAGCAFVLLYILRSVRWRKKSLV